MPNKAKQEAEERNIAAAAKCTAEHTFPPKLGGWDFYKSINSPKYIVAPMVHVYDMIRECVIFESALIR